MAEGTYEYECMRAELLGLSKPNKEEFQAQQKERLAHQTEELDDKTIEEVEYQNDDLKNVSGGLDELHSILSITQKKLNRFKSACGSLTNLLKIKVGHSESTESIPMKDADEKNELESSDSQTDSPPPEAAEEEEEQVAVHNGSKKSDLAKALDSQVNKLDSMIIRADNAQYSMAHQTKQMKAFLK